MTILLLVASIIVTFTIALVLPKQEKFGTFYKIGAGLLTLIGISLGSTKGCMDKWFSHNIGRRGACSYHGGTQDFVNDFGYGIIVLATIIIISIFIMSYIQNKESIGNKH